MHIISGGCHKCGNDILGNLIEGECVECKAQYWFTPCYDDDDDILQVIPKTSTQQSPAADATTPAFIGVNLIITSRDSEARKGAAEN